MTRLRLVLWPILAVGLTACFPLTLYYKQGEQVARMDRDLTDCRVSALARVPADIRTRYIPPVYDTNTVCDAAGTCRHFRILISPARWESYDANEGLRAKVEDQCMMQKGYTEIRLPACNAATIDATHITATRVMPPLTGDSCAIRLKSGRWQIVTPGG